ncbi:MAG: complex I NDUFA9 subunit family protein, partial [Gammaproteobacteria bacterium]|nr:complex I NDUFA9 subunit family protein [Gammaproteobacteria bacterium]
MKICILGGTGFVGRHLIASLAALGYHCLVLSRHPQRHYQLTVAGQVELQSCDPFDQDHLIQHFQGCDAVINLIGILNEQGRKRSFKRMHVELGDHVVEACKQAGVPRLLHMSALNASQTRGSSQYLHTKGEAENRAHTLGKPKLKVTSFRPSVIFGQDDSFFNRFASLLALPGPFPLACPQARFAPVYIEDVVAAFTHSLESSATCDKHYDLCGPRVFTLMALVRYTAEQIGRRKIIFGLNDPLSRLQATILGLMPGKPFTLDNYHSMQLDSVCTGENN